MMRFGRFVRADLEKTGEKPDTFDFLGFKHVCGTGTTSLSATPHGLTCLSRVVS